jgi:outer membrane protein TolC
MFYGHSTGCTGSVDCGQIAFSADWVEADRYSSLVIDDHCLFGLEHFMRLARPTSGGLAHGACWMIIFAVTLAGCLSPATEPLRAVDESTCLPGSLGNSGLLEPSAADLAQPAFSAPIGLRPHTIREDDLAADNYQDLSLSEAVEYALKNTKVLRELGGAILRTPDQIDTKFSPSAVASDPRYGIESALSAFDTKFSASGNFEKNNRAFNNIFFGGGTRLFNQDLNVYQMQFSKTAATGTEFFLRNFTDYNANNAPGNQFPSAWNSNVELAFRHPLLQGSGVEFNRIAGPQATPGAINGVVIARVNTKISQAEFEIGLRDFVSNIINAYWDLYYSYRELDARIKARDKSFQTWQSIQGLEASGRVTSDRLALAEEQYFRFQEEVENSLSGKQFDGTRTFSGTTGGTFRGSGGVQISERRLRLLIGFPITEAKLLRPSDEPDMAEIIFDYDASVVEAMSRRSELKRQRLKTEKRELELVASRNFLMPQLDATGTYRFRGFGRDLSGGDPANGQFASAWGNLTTGNFQEWQAGVELNVPIGFRQGHTTVLAAEINLARERAVLYEQERQIVHDLSNSLAEAERAYSICKNNLNRYRAAKNLVLSLEAGVKNAKQTVDLLDRLLDAHRRLTDAEARYFLARTEYEIALKNVFFEKGSLFDYYSLHVTDGAREEPKPRL